MNNLLNLFILYLVFTEGFCFSKIKPKKTYFQLYDKEKLHCDLTNDDYENNLQRKNIYEKFDHYSKIGHLKKQQEYFEKIGVYLKEKTMIDDFLNISLYDDHDDQYNRLLEINRYYIEKFNK